MDLTTYYDLMRYLENESYPVGYTEEQQKRIRQKAKHFIIINGLLYKKNRQKEPANPLRVLKENEIESVMANLHSDLLAGHFGFEGTYQRILKRYWWNGMGTDIKNFVKTCEACQRTGGRITKQPLHPIKVGQSFDRIVIDLVGSCKVTRKRNRYIAIAIDPLTKWPEAKAIPNKEASTIAKFIFEEIICRHGCPKELQSDQGTEFTAQIIEELTTQFGIKQKFSSPYHPQTNGIVERFNHTLCGILQKYCIALNDQWDVYIPSALFAYRTLQNNTTKHEPFFLIYGREAHLPIDLKYPSSEDQNDNLEDAILNRIFSLIQHLSEEINTVQQKIAEQQQQMKERHDTKLKRITQFEIGDKVLVYNMKQHVTHGNKFQSQWSTEWFYIHETFGNGAYKLRNQQDQLLKKTFNGTQLKYYFDRNDYLEPKIIIEHMETQLNEE